MVLRKSIVSTAATAAVQESLYGEPGFSDLSDRQQGVSILTFLGTYFALDQYSGRIPFTYAGVALVFLIFFSK